MCHQSSPRPTLTLKQMHTQSEALGLRGSLLTPGDQTGAVGGGRMRSRVAGGLHLPRTQMASGLSDHTGVHNRLF